MRRRRRRTPLPPLLLLLLLLALRLGSPNPDPKANPKPSPNPNPKTIPNLNPRPDSGNPIPSPNPNPNPNPNPRPDAGNPKPHPIPAAAAAATSAVTTAPTPAKQEPTPKPALEPTPKPASAPAPASAPQPRKEKETLVEKTAAAPPPPPPPRKEEGEDDENEQPPPPRQEALIEIYEDQAWSWETGWRPASTRWTYGDGSDAVSPADVQLPEGWGWSGDWSVRGSTVAPASAVAAFAKAANRTNVEAMLTLTSGGWEYARELDQLHAVYSGRGGRPRAKKRPGKGPAAQHVRRETWIIGDTGRRRRWRRVMTPVEYAGGKRSGRSALEQQWDALRAAAGGGVNVQGLRLLEKEDEAQSPDAAAASSSPLPSSSTTLIKRNATATAWEWLTAPVTTAKARVIHITERIVGDFDFRGVGLGLVKSTELPPQATTLAKGLVLWGLHQCREFVAWSGVDPSFQVPPSIARAFATSDMNGTGGASTGRWRTAAAGPQPDPAAENYFTTAEVNDEGDLVAPVLEEATPEEVVVTAPIFEQRKKQNIMEPKTRARERLQHALKNVQSRSIPLAKRGVAAGRNLFGRSGAAAAKAYQAYAAEQRAQSNRGGIGVGLRVPISLNFRTLRLNPHWLWVSSFMGATVLPFSLFFMMSFSLPATTVMGSAVRPFVFVLLLPLHIVLFVWNKLVRVALNRNVEKVKISSFTTWWIKSKKSGGAGSKAEEKRRRRYRVIRKAGQIMIKRIGVTLSVRYDPQRGPRVLWSPWLFLSSPGANIVYTYQRLAGLLAQAYLCLYLSVQKVQLRLAEEFESRRLRSAAGESGGGGAAAAAVEARERRSQAVMTAAQARWMMLAFRIAARSSRLLEWIGFLNYELGFSFWYSDGLGTSLLMNVIPPYMYR